MGFIDDIAVAQAHYHYDDDEKVVADVNDDNENTFFSEQIENDPGLVEELRAVERELAEAYPNKEHEGEERNGLLADAAVKNEQ